MPNSPHLLQAPGPHAKTYNISIVGFPRSGKSCICNRISSPHPDLYRKDHLSILNQTGFDGEVVNCDHWLYWGCVSRQIEDDIIKCRIIEQTEFFNDSTFPSSHPKLELTENSTLDYIRRSSLIRLSSVNKLQYVCKEHIGREFDFSSEYFPSGEIEVNGFILVYDANSNTYLSNGASSRNVIHKFLSHLIKLKKPVLLALSKVDGYNGSTMDELSLLLKSSEFRKVPIIETSAHRNVNIEQTFKVLLKLMECKQRVSKFKYLSYHETLREKNCELEIALKSFARLLATSHPEFLIDWDTFMGRYSYHADVVIYINIVGSQYAQNKFNYLIEERCKTIRQQILDKIPEILKLFIPTLDFVNNLSFDQIVSLIRHHQDFSLHFNDVLLDSHDKLNRSENSSPCTIASSRLCMEEIKIPFRLVLESSDGVKASPLKQHIIHLSAIYHKHYEQALLEISLHQHFFNVMNNTSNKTNLQLRNILPNQPIFDVKKNIDLLNLSVLTEEDIAMIYKQFQFGFHIRAREDFLDLLIEKTDFFVKAVTNYFKYLRECSSSSLSLSELTNIDQSDLSNRNNVELNSNFTNSSVQLSHIGLINQSHRFIAPPPGVKETQLKWLDYQLAQDSRYQEMTFLTSERQTLIAAYFDMLMPFSHYRWFSKSNSSHTVRDDLRVSKKLFPVHGTLYATKSLNNPDCLLGSEPRFYSNSITQSQLDILNLSHQSKSDSIYKPCSLCPSTSWGGCMDSLFKHLAYEHMPTNPRCFEEPYMNCIGKDEGCSIYTPLDLCPCTPNDHRSTSFLFLESQSMFNLNIGIVCVCTDTLAAYAIFNLLACIGFSMFSFSLSGKSSGPISDLNIDDISSFTNSTIHEQSDPLILSAIWPLVAARLPPLNISQNATKQNNNNTNCKAGKSGNLNKICEGQVHAHLMSHHMLLNKLIGSRNNVGSYDGASNSSSGLNSPNAMNYNGIIYIISIPSSTVDKPYMLSDEPRQSTTQSLHNESVNLSNITDKNIRLTQSVDSLTMASDNFDPIFTPRSLSDKPIFGPNDFGIPSVVSKHAPSCTCCKLLGCEKSIPSIKSENLECTCGHCCNCVHSPKTANHSNYSAGNCENNTTEKTKARQKGFHPSVVYPHRMRSREACLAAVNSIINKIPKTIPHMALLVEPGHLGGKDKDVYDCTHEHSPPFVYLASENSKFPLDFNFLRSDSSLRTLNDELISSPINLDTKSSDWIPVGTNILDHVIMFLDKCWDNLDQPTSTQSPIPSHRTSIHCVSTKQNVPSPRSNSLHLSMVSNPTPVTSWDVLHSPDKPFAGAILSTLSVASATGRKAMQTANQAFKKLSNSAKRYNNSKSVVHPTSSKCADPNLCNSPKRGHETSLFFNCYAQTNQCELVHDVVSNQNNVVDLPEQVSHSGNHPGRLVFDSTSNSDSVFHKTEFNQSVDQTTRGLHASPTELTKSRTRLSFVPLNLNKLHDSMSNSTPRPRGLPDLTKSNLSEECATIPVGHNPFVPSSVANNLSLPIPEIASPSSSSCVGKDSSQLFGLSNPIVSKLANSGEYVSSVGWETSPTYSNESLNLKQKNQLSGDVLVPPCSAIPSILDCTDLSSNPPKHHWPNYHTLVNQINNNNNSNLLLNDEMVQKPNTIHTSCPDSDNCFLPPNHQSQIKALGQEDLESIYDDPYVYLDVSQPNVSKFLPPLTISTSIDEHIYMNPIDCLAPACVERFRSNHCNYSHLRSDRNKSFARDIYKNTTSVYSESLTSLPWTSNVFGERPERHRSFSTPEGCPVIAHNNYLNDNPSISSAFLSRSVPHPLSSNHVHFPSTRSCIDANNYMAFCKDTNEFPTTMTTTRTPAKVSVSYSTPVSSPASGTTADEFIENILHNEDLFNSNLFNVQSLLNPLSPAHHHHFWHHPKCPHYNCHHTTIQNKKDSIGTPLKAVNRNRNCIHSPRNNEFFEEIQTISSKNLTGHSIGKSILSPTSIFYSTGSQKLVTKPVFVDPGDFQIHHPQTCPFSSNFSSQL